MVIEFNRPNNISVATNQTNTNTSQKTTKTSSSVGTHASSASTTGESVNLSPTAQHMGQITEKLRDTPAVDSERVTKLKAAIENGTYQVDSQRLAGKLIDAEP